MKLAAILISSLLLTAAGTQAAIYSRTVGTIIPDGNPAGLSSSIEIADSVEAIQDVWVTLNVSGGCNGDLYAYLTHGDGFVVLLNRVGKTGEDAFGYADSGLLNVVLRDNADTDMHLYGGNGGAALTGAWQPDGRNTDPLTVLDADARSTTLGTFATTGANGTWTLFFADMAAGPEGSASTLQSWSLNLNPIPEPTHVALAVFGGLGLLRLAWRFGVRRFGWARNRG